MFPIFMGWAWWPMAVPPMFKSLWSGWPWLFLVPVPVILFLTFRAVFIIKNNWRNLSESTEADRPILRLLSVRAELPDSGGLVIHFKAKKPADFQFSEAILKLEGKEFWETLSEVVGRGIISTFKMALYPVALCPTYLDSSQFQSGQTIVQSQVAFMAAGQSRVVKKSTIVKRLKWLVEAGDPKFQVLIEYGKYQFGWQKQGVLLAFDTKLGDWLQSAEQNTDLQLDNAGTLDDDELESGISESTIDGRHEVEAGRHESEDDRHEVEDDHRTFFWTGDYASVDDPLARTEGDDVISSSSTAPALVSNTTVVGTTNDRGGTSDWACTACTYLNSALSKRCEMCGTASSSSILSAFASTSTSAPASASRPASNLFGEIGDDDAEDWVANLRAF
jgi:hypothetical protein